MNALLRPHLRRLSALLVAAMLQGLADDACAQTSPEESINLYADAANLQNNGSFESAAIEWERFLQRYPTDPLAANAQHYLGICYLQLKRLDKAAAAFEAVIKKYPKLDLIQVTYLNLGWCQYLLGGQKVEGAYAKAAATLAALVKNFPDGKNTEQALFFLGEAEYNQGKKKEAAAAYDQLLKKFPQSSLRSDVLYALGVTYEELGQYADAGKAYDLFLQEFPKHGLANEVRMRKAETVLQAGDLSAAEKLFAEVAKTAGFASVDHALSRQAFCLYKQNKFAEAAAAYARIPAEFPQSAYAADATLSVGRCYYRAEQFPEAAKWLQKAAEAPTAGRAEAAHWLCRIFLREKQPEKAIDLAKRTLPQAADSPFAVNLLMDQADALYDVGGSRPEAVALYLKIATDHPRHEVAAQALYNAAFGALEMGKYGEGLKHAAAFFTAYPAHRLAADVQYVAAECHLQLGEHADAEQMYAELARSWPDHPDHETWQVRQGVAMFLQKKHSEAVAALEPIVAKLKNADNQAHAQFVLGVSQFHLEQFDRAVTALRAALKANPKWKQADETLLYLARVLRKQDKTPEAIKTIAQLIADWPSSRLLDQAHYRYGEFAYAAGDYKTALTQFDAVAATAADSPFVPYALYGKGWVQLKNKAYPEAIETFAVLGKGHPQHALIPDTHLALGMCLRQIGKLDEAINEFDLYLSGQGDGANKADALYERGLAEVALKEYGKAAETFQQVLTANPQYTAADKIAYELAWALKSVPDDAKKAEAVAAFAELASKYPDSPLAAEANFHVGESRFQKAEYDGAVSAYTVAKQTGRSGELREKATYKLGWSLFQNKKYREALAEFSVLAKNQAQGPLDADSLFMKAECLFRLEKYDEALPIYLALPQDGLPSPVSQVLALLHGGQSALQVEKWDQAISLLSQVTEKHAASPYLSEACCELGRAKHKSGKAAEAVQDFEKATELSRGAVGARARFMVGELHFEANRFEEAIRHFQRVLSGYGGDQAGDEVKPWQAKAAFEAARCFELLAGDASGKQRQDHLSNAKTLHALLEQRFPGNDLARRAKPRLPLLATAANLSTPATGDVKRDEIHAQTVTTGGSQVGRKYAFLVAVKDYDDTQLRDLNFTRNDVIQFRDVLLQSGFTEDTLVLMHDDLATVGHRRYIPERRNILHELDSLLRELRETDLLVVAFVGHGVQFRGEKVNYFCPADANLEDRNTLISLRSVYDTVAACRASCRLMLIDACRRDPSAALSRGRETVALESVTRPQSEPVPQGVVALFSCSAGEESYEHPELEHGVFFYQILQGWRGAADLDRDRVVTLGELVEYTRTKTASFTRQKLDRPQTPELRSEYTGNWVLRVLSN